MVHHSSDLIWQVVRNNSCFIKKQANLPVMSLEADNLAGLNSFKYSGFANKSVGLKVVKNGKKEVITLTKKQKSGHKISKIGSATLKTGIKKSNKKAVEQIRKELSAGGYRRDLIDAATQKFMKIKASLRKPRVQEMAKRRSARQAKAAAQKKSD